MAFEVDDRVVHPQHGVGRVIKLETRQFASGKSQLYYKIAIPNGTLWVQVDESSKGLRKLTSRGDLDKYRDMLKSRPSPLTANHRQRQIELTDRLREGTFQAVCEIVRDLTALGWYKPLGEGNNSILRLAYQALYQEWAAAGELSLIEASREVETLLSEGKHLYKE